MCRCFKVCFFNFCNRWNLSDTREMYLYIAILKYRNLIRSGPTQSNIHFTTLTSIIHIWSATRICIWRFCQFHHRSQVTSCFQEEIFLILICDYDHGMIRILRVSEHDGIMTYENIWGRRHSFVSLCPRIILLWRIVMKRISKSLVRTEISEISRQTPV